MSKKKIIIISIIILIIAGVIIGIYIYNEKDKQRRETLIYNSKFSTTSDIFCVEGTKYKNEKGKDIIKDYKINTKLLATKIYVYVKKHGEFSNLKYFYNQYKGDKTNLDGEASWLYKEIYEKNKEQDHLQQKEEIEKIEEWLKNGQLQKLEEWLSKQEF